VSDPSQKGLGGFDPGGNFNGKAPLGACKVAIKVSSAPPGGGPPGAGSSRPPTAGGPPVGGPPKPGGDGKVSGPPKMAGSEITPKMMDANKSGVEVNIVPNAKLDIDFKK